MLSAAAQCQPIINAYEGYSYNSERTPQAIMDEPRARMSLKSEQWVGCQLSPAFYGQMMESEWEFGQNIGPAHSDTFAHQDFYVMFMGL